MRTIKVVDKEEPEGFHGNAKTVIFDGRQMKVAWNPESVDDAKRFHEEDIMTEHMANTIVAELNFELMHSPDEEELTDAEKAHCKAVILAAL